MSDELPPALKRDANNVAPFMLRAARAKALDELIAADAELLDMDAVIVNREANLPASPPNWVPPWESKS